MTKKKRHGLPKSELCDFLTRVAFGVVLVSLLLQGLTIPKLMRLVGVGPDDAEPEPAEHG